MPFRYHWLPVLILGIILLIIFFIAYVLKYQEAEDLPFWLWFIFLLSLVFILLSFGMHATQVAAAGPIPNSPDGGQWYQRGLSYNVEDVAKPYPTYIGKGGSVSSPSVDCPAEIGCEVSYGICEFVEVPSC